MWLDCRILPQSVERWWICGEQLASSDSGGSLLLEMLRNDACMCSLSLKAVSLFHLNHWSHVKCSRNAYLSHGIISRKLSLHNAGARWSGDHSGWHAKTQAAEQQTLLQLKLGGWGDSLLWLGLLAFDLLVLDHVEVNVANAIDDIL